MRTTPVVEIERKYDVEDTTPLPPLKDLRGIGRVEIPVEHQISAEYFDTADLRLAPRQITLRRQKGGDDAGWRLTLPAASNEPQEYREPLGNEADGVPEALQRLVRVYVRDSALIPVARLTTMRVIHRLRGKNGDVLADFSDDRVLAQTLTPEHGTQHWREWEIQLVGGSRDLLEAGQEMLAAGGIRPAKHGSTLARALGPHLHPDTGAPSPPKAKGPAADVVLAYLREHAQVLRDQDPGVRLDAHDSVHRMRVAIRRMRSVLATYRSLLDDAESVTFLRDELKWLAGVLGEARDAEVMHERLKDMIAEEQTELVMGPVTRRVDIELGADYQKAHAKALEVLDGKRYYHLLEALESLLAAPPLAPLASRPAHKVIPKLIQRDAKRLRTAVREAKNHPAGTGDHPALHEARKDGKRLRYAVEAAAPINRKKAARLADAAHGVQKILGDHQDSVVTRDMLRRLATAAYLQGESAFSYGRLHALEQSAALEAEAHFHREWKKFPSASLKK